MNTKKRGTEGSLKNKRKFIKPMESADKVGAVKRSLWYILKLIIVIAVIAALCYGVFTEAIYLSNIYIIVTEGMEMRADCILKNDALNKLSEHFSKDWLEKDEAFSSKKYDAFHVDSYIYNIRIEKLKVYPWSDTAELQVTEKVTSISAKPLGDEENIQIPKWENARYGIMMKKDKGRWLIDEISLIEANPVSEPANTPDYSRLETDIPHW